MKRIAATALMLALAGGGALVAAQEDARQAVIDQIVASITDRDPVVRYDPGRVDAEHLVVERIDLVDEDGLIRMTLAGKLPGPVVDGIEYQRSHTVSGIMIRDADGNEAGGLGFHETFDGPIFALDQDGSEGGGLVMLPDGGSMFLLGNAGEMPTDPRVPGHRLPAPGSAPTTTMYARVNGDGTQVFALADPQGNERLRFSVGEDGAGRIEFLNAEGEVIETLAPELAR